MDYKVKAEELLKEWCNDTGYILKESSQYYEILSIINRVVEMVVDEHEEEVCELNQIIDNLDEQIQQEYERQMEEWV